MRYLSITAPDVNNGEGFRVTLWVAGCSHHCKGCHNPETWSYKQGKPLREIKKDLFAKLDKSYIKGITLSGGDPLDQNNGSLIELIILVSQIKKRFPDKDIWVYSGDVYENLIKDPLKRALLKKCDVLVDGPYRYAQRDTSLPFRGSANQRIINLKECEI